MSRFVAGTRQPPDFHMEVMRLLKRARELKIASVEVRWKDGAMDWGASYVDETIEVCLVDLKEGQDGQEKHA